MIVLSDKDNKVVGSFLDGTAVTNLAGVTDLPPKTDPNKVLLIDKVTQKLYYSYADLATAQTAKLAEINNLSAQKIDDGYYSYAEGAKNADGTAKALQYKADITHQLDMLGELQLAQAGQSCTWKDSSIVGLCHVVTAAVVEQLYNEMVAHIKWCKTTADTLCGEVMAATTVDGVTAITFPDEPAPAAPMVTA